MAADSVSVAAFERQSGVLEGSASSRITRQNREQRRSGFTESLVSAEFHKLTSRDSFAPGKRKNADTDRALAFPPLTRKIRLPDENRPAARYSRAVLCRAGRSGHAGRGGSKGTGRPAARQAAADHPDRLMESGLVPR